MRSSSFLEAWRAGRALGATYREDDAVQASIQELFTSPGAWIGEGAVHVRPSADLIATRRAVDLATGVAERLGALFTADAERPVLDGVSDGVQDEDDMDPLSIFERVLRFLSDVFSPPA